MRRSAPPSTGYLPAVLSLLLILSCAADKPADTADTAADDGGGDSDAPNGDDTGDDTGDAPPVDRDSDGVTDDTDCDDLDPRRYPGAEEVWDELDNDCDGLVDADGAFTGGVTLTASVVYKSTPYSWTLECPLDMTRLEGELAFGVVCLPYDEDPEQQELQHLLIGELLVINPYPGDEAVEGGDWEGWTLFTSSEGWDSEGEGRVTWTDMDSAEVEISLDSVWLTISGSGSVSRSY